jgi:hypothetical protein
LLKNSSSAFDGHARTMIAAAQEIDFHFEQAPDWPLINVHGTARGQYGRGSKRGARLAGRRLKKTSWDVAPFKDMWVRQWLYQTNNKTKPNSQ